MGLCLMFFFCFKQKTAYEMRISDWSSDVCSSDLHATLALGAGIAAKAVRAAALAQLRCQFRFEARSAPAQQSIQRCRGQVRETSVTAVGLRTVVAQHRSGGVAGDIDIG